MVTDVVADDPAPPRPDPHRQREQIVADVAERAGHREQADAAVVLQRDVVVGVEAQDQVARGPAPEDLFEAVDRLHARAGQAAAGGGTRSQRTSVRLPSKTNAQAWTGSAPAAWSSSA